MTQAIDRLDLSEPDAVQEYGALVRALRRKQGFGLFFVQASPANGQEILMELRRDLPQKQVIEVTLGAQDKRLFEQLETIRELVEVDIFWIEGLEQSLLGYEDMQRLAGWDMQDLMTYSWKDVPPILSHLNLARERFEAKFDCALVFVVPLFVVKYLLQRAGDFFDWKSGFFEFPDDRQALANDVMEDTYYGTYKDLHKTERLEKIFQIQDLLNEPTLELERRAELLREIGRLFELDKEYEQASIFYGQAIHLRPDFSEAWNDTGIILRKLGRYGAAIDAHQKAIELNPQHYLAYNNLGISHFYQKEYEAAIRAYEKAIELNPQNHLAYNSLGITYFHQKKYEEAIEAYKKAVKLNPQYAFVYRNLGNAYSSQADYALAIEAYQKAIKLNPRDISTYSNMGSSYFHQKKYEEALEAYQKAIELNPKDTFIYSSMGITYFRQKKYEDAISCCQKAIKLNPRDAFFHRNLGDVYRSQKDYELAIQAYQKSISLNSQDVKSYRRLASVYKNQRNYESAMKVYQTVIEIKPDDNWANRNCARIYLQTNQPEKAIQNFDLSKIDSKNDSSYYLRALAHLKLNQPESAGIDFQQAISIAQATYEKDPIAWWNTFNLALYHLAAAHPEESDRLYTSNLTAPIEWLQMAIDDLDDFLQLFPDHSQAQQVKQLLQGAIDATQPTTL
jgi:tetratricopeptide (TPR) repeat protein